MVHNCFLCTGKIRSNSLSSEENFILLCQILDIRNLGQEVKEFDGIDFCHRCYYKILSIRDMLEELEKLEKKILDEKFLIEDQLKNNSRQRNGVIVFSSSDSKNMNELRSKIGVELTAGTIQSMLKKMSKKQVGRKPLPRKPVRIMRNVEIQNIPTPGNETPGMFRGDPQSPVSDSASEITGSNVIVSQESPIDCHERLPLENELQSKSVSEETMEDPFKISLSQETWPSSEVDDVGIDIKYEMNLNLSDVCNDTFEVDVVRSSESNEQMDTNDQIIAGTSTESASNSLKSELGVCDRSGVTKFTDVQGEVEGSGGNTKIFICGTCVTSFDSYNLLLIHERMHKRRQSSNSTKSRKSSTQIEKKPRNSKNRKKRQSLKPWERPKECEECGRMLSSRRTWKVHVMQLHRMEHKFKCTLCDYGTQKKGDLEEHQYIHSNVWSFKCHVCKKAFKYKKCLTKHLKIHTRQERTDSEES